MIESFFKDAPIKPFQADGFLILAVPVTPDNGEEAEEWMKNHLKESSSGYNVVFNEAFQEMPPDTILRGVIVKPKNVQELFQAANLSEIPPQVTLFLDSFLDKVRWVSFGVNPYDLSAFAVVQTASEDDASELRELLESMQDGFVESLRLGMHAGVIQAADGNPAMVLFTEYIPLATEIIRGANRQLLPRIDGAKLAF